MDVGYTPSHFIRGQRQLIRCEFIAFNALVTLGVTEQQCNRHTPARSARQSPETLVFANVLFN